MPRAELEKGLCEKVREGSDAGDARGRPGPNFISFRSRLCPSGFSESNAFVQHTALT